MQLFPNIGIDKDMLQVSPSMRNYFNQIMWLAIYIILGSYWSELINRRAFLDNLARKKGIDPLAAESWYKYPELANEKVKIRIWNNIEG